MDNSTVIKLVSDYLTAKNHSFAVEKMFGGEWFVMDGKKYFAAFRGHFLVRLDADDATDALKNGYITDIIEGAKRKTGYVFVSPEGFDHLENWIEKSLAFVGRSGVK